MGPNNRRLIPAPYGTACTNCVKRKCKCMLQGADETSCDRCQRLGKECIRSNSVRYLAGADSRRARVSRRRAPEDELVYLGASFLTGPTPTDNGLRNGKTRSSVPVPVPATPPLSAYSPSQTAAVEREPDLLSKRSKSAFTFPDNFNVPDYVPSVPRCSVTISPRDAEDRLARFRARMLCQFPLVNLPDSMTASQLREQMPFLWFNIMTVTAESVQAQSLMSTAVREHVAHKMVVEHEKSMDLLLGLLVFMGWSHFHRKKRLYLTLFGSLAMSLVYDLFLDRPPAQPPASILCDPKLTVTPPTERTMEMRRASLASFYLTSSIALKMRKLKPLSWLSLYDEDIQVLTQKQECPGDRVLVDLVKVQQLVVDPISSAAAQPPTENGTYGGGIIHSYLDSIEAQLVAIKNDMPPDLPNHDLLPASIQHASLLLSETRLLHHHPHHPDSPPSLTRHALIHTTLHASLAFLDLLCTLPPHRVLHAPFLLWVKAGDVLAGMVRRVHAARQQQQQANQSSEGEGGGSSGRAGGEPPREGDGAGLPTPPGLVDGTVAAGVGERLAGLAEGMVALWRREGADPDSVLLWMRGMIDVLAATWKREAEAAGFGGGGGGGGGGGNVGPGILVPGFGMGIGVRVGTAGVPTASAAVDVSSSSSPSSSSPAVSRILASMAPDQGGVTGHVGGFDAAGVEAVAVEGGVGSGGGFEEPGGMAAWSPWFMDIFQAPWD